MASRPESPRLYPKVWLSPVPLGLLGASGCWGLMAAQLEPWPQVSLLWRGAPAAHCPLPEPPPRSQIASQSQSWKPAVWPGADPLTSLSLGFLSCQMVAPSTQPQPPRATPRKAPGRSPHLPEFGDWLMGGAVCPQGMAVGRWQEEPGKEPRQMAPSPEPLERPRTMCFDGSGPWQ